MPYIGRNARAYVDTYGPASASDLNYAITKLLIAKPHPDVFAVQLGNLLHRFMTHGEPDFADEGALTYQTINDAFGAVLLALREYRRRTGRSSDLDVEAVIVLENIYDNVVAEFEDGRIASNGDLYPEEK